MNFVRFFKNPKSYAVAASTKFRNFTRTYLNKGTNVHCEICKWDGTQFFKGKCPKCNSLPRTRLIPFSLRHFKLLKKNLRILHIAPNLNEYNYVKNNFENIEIYDRLNIRTVPHINIVQDITATNLSTNSYDLVIVWHVLEHIVEDKKAATEIYRILKPGGHLLISVPIYPTGNLITYEDASIPYKQYEKVHGHDDHCRSCGLDYYKRFEQIGFTVKTLDKFTKENLKTFGLSKHHVVWCFTA